MSKNIMPLKNYISEYSVRNKNNQDIPVYSVTNSAGFCTEYFSKEVASKDKTTYKIVPKGYFAYNPSRINVGSVDWQKSEEHVIVSPLYVVFGVSPELDQQYLLYYLKSDITLNYIRAYATGSVRDNLKFSTLQEFPINLCSLEKQKEIVSKLDHVDSLITARREQLAKLDELVKSRFVELFGDTILNPYNWDKEPLGKVCDVRDGTHDSPKYYDTGYPLVTSKNLSSGDIDFTDCSLICKNDFDKINERSKVDFGDILMPMIGTVGNPVIVKIKDEFAIKNVALIKFCDNTKVTNIYIQALLKSDYFDSEVLGKVRGGTQKFISLGDIRKLEILVPPMELQNQFAEFVEQTDKSKFAIQKSLEKLETLKKALMQKYFG